MLSTTLKIVTLLLILLLAGCGSEGTTGSSDSNSHGLTGRVDRRDLKTSEFGFDFAVSDDWGQGFVAQVTITNHTAERVNDWKVEFDFDRDIVDLWNARIVSHQGDHYVLEGQSYNSWIEPGASVAFGFQGTPGGLAGGPVDVLLAGQSAEEPPPPPEEGPPAEESPPPVTGLSVTYRTVDDWGSGFVGEVTLTNSTSADLEDWSVVFETDRTITNLWNAVVLAQGPPSYEVGPESYNRVLPAGGAVTFGFQGTPGNLTALQSLSLLSDSGGAPPPPEDPAPTPEDPAPEPQPPAPTAEGFLHAEGARIVDSQGNTVRLTGVNWFGLETSNFAPHGLWSRSMDSMLDQMSELGYNCLRVPFSNQMLDAGSIPNSIDYSLNPDLSGLSGLQILDRLIEKAGQRGLRVILDRHRPSAGGQSALWYTNEYGQARWIADWERLAERYRDNPTVVGFDLHNEPHGAATWGDGNPSTDWRLAAETAGNRILAINPDLLIIVEGVESVDGHSYWWGGNLRAAGAKPVRLDVPGRLIYSAHDYPTSVFEQAWFSDPAYPDNLEPLWDETWGYLVKQDIAPVLLGEFGTFDETEVDRTWFRTLADYLGHTGVSFTYWSWNPNSGDTGGLLQDDWHTVHQEKHSVLEPLLFP